mmetsp:Transcript_36391/g.76055  ORF Transcript_36391/g.76055 Transcript_36391/m.76055 type:complete len:146 (+) Transcript_36391:2-439(+)
MDVGRDRLGMLVVGVKDKRGNQRACTDSTISEVASFAECRTRASEENFDSLFIRYRLCWLIQQLDRLVDICYQSREAQCISNSAPSSSHKVEVQTTHVLRFQTSRMDLGLTRYCVASRIHSFLIRAALVRGMSSRMVFIRYNFRS